MHLPHKTAYIGHGDYQKTSNQAPISTGEAGRSDLQDAAQRLIYTPAWEAYFFQRQGFASTGERSKDIQAGPNEAT